MCQWMFSVTSVSPWLISLRCWVHHGATESTELHDLNPSGDVLSFQEITAADYAALQDRNRRPRPFYRARAAHSQPKQGRLQIRARSAQRWEPRMDANEREY